MKKMFQHSGLCGSSLENRHEGEIDEEEIGVGSSRRSASVASVCLL
jgi:hypothetical protein